MAGRYKDPDYLKKWRAANREKLNTRAREVYELRKDMPAYAASIEAHKEKTKLRSAEYNKSPQRKASYRKHRLKKKYGLSPDHWDLLFASQGRSCAICRCVEALGRGWVVDHCHTSLKIRGILCPNCNFSIGHMRDDPDRLRLAADYVERHA